MRHLLLAGLACFLSFCFETGASAAEPEPLPIQVADDKEPGALHRWHLYERTDAKCSVGEEIAFVGRVEQGKSEIYLKDPPWITVALPLPKQAASDRPETWQTFHFLCNDLESILPAGGFARFTGKVGIHRPELSPQEKSNQGLAIFQLAGATAKSIHLARTVDQMRGDAAAVIRREAARLRQICTDNKLEYAPDEDLLAESWYKGNVAFTTIVSRHPGFSFRPVPYATISVLFDPASGAATRLIFTRRIWQDPRD